MTKYNPNDILNTDHHSNLKKTTGLISIIVSLHNLNLKEKKTIAKIQHNTINTDTHTYSDRSDTLFSCYQINDPKNIDLEI